MEKNITGMVGLMADPSWPMRIAKKISSQLAEELSAQTQIQWEVEVTLERLP